MQFFINIVNIWGQIRYIIESEDKEEVNEKIMKFSTEIMEELTAIKL
ncbi:hypothetical protein SAMN05446037_100577 [Anaerovirgula multivorans]|uniref:Uncharacterized protein n=1 Tax=Anaerovirgula multivorans TaxID=312168 RepID=A0A239C8W5_9FIRM|nr:hypothetical protein SAMN05446037_100577 [Anaerovirgula multivorans]